jgi:hypothetical protein
MIGLSLSWLAGDARCLWRKRMRIHKKAAKNRAGPVPALFLRLFYVKINYAIFYYLFHFQKFISPEISVSHTQTKTAHR